MNLKHIIFAILLLSSLFSFSQFKITGIIKNNKNVPLNKGQIYNATGGLLAESNLSGEFTFTLNKKEITLLFYSDNYRIKNIKLISSQYKNISIVLDDFEEELSEIQIKSRKQKVFELKRLKDVEGTSIFAGKKQR